MRASRLTFVGAIVLVLIAGLSAVFLVRSAQPSCPLDAVAVGDVNPAHCARGVNPTDAPSSVEFFLVTQDSKVRERGLIVGVGILGAVFLVALGLRLLPEERRDAPEPRG